MPIYKLAIFLQIKHDHKLWRNLKQLTTFFHREKREIIQEHNFLVVFVADPH